MKAGRALDLLVAEKVMGRDMTKPLGFKYPIGLPRYSTDIAAAWDVAEQVAENCADSFTLSRSEDGFIVSFRLAGKGRNGYSDAEGHARSLSAPHAICLAALAAVGAPAPAEPHTQEKAPRHE